MAGPRINYILLVSGIELEQYRISMTVFFIFTLLHAP